MPVPLLLFVCARSVHGQVHATNVIDPAFLMVFFEAEAVRRKVTRFDVHWGVEEVAPNLSTREWTGIGDRKGLELERLDAVATARSNSHVLRIQPLEMCMNGVYMNDAWTLAQSKVV